MRQREEVDIEYVKLQEVFLVFCEALNKPTLLGKCFGVSYRAIL